MLFRDCFRRTAYNLLRFCVHFSTNFTNHALSKMILLRGELGSITFDVGIRVQVLMYMPLNIYKKLHNLEYLCYDPYRGIFAFQISWEP